MAANTSSAVVRQRMHIADDVALVEEGEALVEEGEALVEAKTGKPRTRSSASHIVPSRSRRGWRSAVGKTSVTIARNARNQKKAASRGERSR